MPNSEPQSVPQLVEAQAEAKPHALAVEHASTQLTYGQMDAKANQLAHHLRSIGVGSDMPVGLCLERGAEFVTAALAVLKAGGAYLPIDPAYPHERISFLLQDSRAFVLITNQRNFERLPAGNWRVVMLDQDGPILDRYSLQPPRRQTKAESLAYVIYTSGSTGLPKGVAVSHASLANLVYWHRHEFAVTAADRASHLAGLGFDAAVWELWPYLTAGASLHVPDEETRQSRELLRDWLVTQRITITFVPTALAEQMMALRWPANPALRILLTGGDKLHRYPPANLPFRLVNNYGPTEATVVATSGIVFPHENPDQPPPIGRPIDHTQVYILDENLAEVPNGVAGELHIGGAGLARGYLNRPDLTSEKFITNPANGSRLYKTGDHARYLPDGQIAFLGRIDDQVKIRGFRIEPAEVGVVLNAHATVQASVVTALEDMQGENRLVAYIVPAPDTRPTQAALREFLSVRLPDYMIPAQFVLMNSLPMTPNGKVDRSALPVPDAANILRDLCYTAPRTPVEERVAEILAELLGLEQVGVEDNFFLLGGHSLLGAQVIARVSQIFGVDLSLRGLFDNPTVGGMSAEIERLIFAKLDPADLRESLHSEVSYGPKD